jgi:hypothetical protein
MSETDNLQIFDSLQERNREVLNHISQLQIQEQDLYKSLEDETLSIEKKQVIISKINEISQLRLNLYAGLKDMFSHYRQNIDASRSTLGQSVAAVDIVENELNENKMRMNLVDEEQNNKLRLVEINTYFGKRYNTHSKLMKTIVIICIPIIILAFLSNKGILPSNIYALLIVIILVIGTLSIGSQLIDIYNRNNINWDEYDWHFDKSKAPPLSNINQKGIEYKNPWSTLSITCIGSDCCYEGSTYDSEKNICVPNDIYNREHPEKNNLQENFEALGKYAYSQEKTTPFNNTVSPVFAPLSNF